MGRESLSSEKRRELDFSKVHVRSLIELDACTRCGECSVTCPTGGEAEEVEGRTPRGKIRALKKVLRTQSNPLRRLLTREERWDGMLSELSRSIYECSVCGMCGEACPLSFDTIEMWEELRRALVASRLGPMEAHGALVKSIKNYDNPWMQPRAQRGRWSRKMDGVLDATKERVDILYYVGCTASYDPEIGRVAHNLARILASAGVRFGILGQEERCCGSTLLRIGDVDSARELAIENLRLFERVGAESIVTACAGCYKTLKQDYPRLTGVRLPVLHVTQLLERMIRDGVLPLAGTGERMRVTYHDPCHLGRHTELYDSPREIIRMLPGIELVEMERTRERSRCCGAGGGLRTLDLGLTLKIAEMRVEDAERIGVELLVTSCPFCQQTLSEAASKRGGAVRVVDITELVVARLRC